MEMTKRPRRLRGNEAIRRMTRETRLSPESLVYPLFIKEGTGLREEIPSLEGQWRCSPDRVCEEVARCRAAGVSRLLLFGLPSHKDACGSEAWNPNGVVQQAIRAIKRFDPEMYLITDVCMCEYTEHGHCGLLDGQEVDNDRTLELLSRTALSHVQAGADMVAPSDMMDGRVAAIRRTLDENGFQSIPIMAYSAKYASAFYGPFREAAGSAPAFGDRRGYQMDPHNRREALKECALDEEEGADILMVKPALAYGDVIAACAAETRLPVAAYSVSGEYAMLKAAARAGLLDEYRVMCEMAVSVFRAGADILISYYARELAEAMRRGDIG